MSIEAIEDDVCIAVGATRLFCVGYLAELDAGVLLSGTPTVVEQDTSDLAISNIKVNTSTIDIRGVSHLAGQAVQCLVSGAQAGKRYKLLVTASTNSTPPETIPGIVFAAGAAP